MNQDGAEARQKEEADRILKGFDLDRVLLEARLRSSERITHDGDRGEVNEQHFIDWMRASLPDRYTIHKAHVIDSKGTVSDSIDVVVYDRQFATTLFDNEKHRYVPVEAVYAVFECKPDISRETIKYARNKAASVRGLYRTSAPIHGASGMLDPKPLHDIVGGLLAIDASWADGLGKSLRKCLLEDTEETHVLDCGLAVSGGMFDIYDQQRVHEEGKGERRGNLMISQTQNSLAVFLFRFLRQLGRIGNAPAIDWDEYANLYQ